MKEMEKGPWMVGKKEEKVKEDGEVEGKKEKRVKKNGDGEI